MVSKLFLSVLSVAHARLPQSNLGPFEKTDIEHSSFVTSIKLFNLIISLKKLTSLLFHNKTSLMKSKALQHSFFKNKTSKNFGGSALKSNPKSARPLSTRESIHLVLKSHYAVGNKSMLQPQNSNAIREIIDRQAKACGIKVYHFVNVGNHIHLVIKLTRHHLYAKFIRAVTGLIARHVMKKERSVSAASTTKSLRKKNFWLARPFSRIISWGRDFLTVTRYMRKNRTQAYWRKHFVAWGFEVVDPIKIQLMSTA